MTAYGSDGGVDQLGFFGVVLVWGFNSRQSFGAVIPTARGFCLCVQCSRSLLMCQNGVKSLSSSKLWKETET